MPKDFKWSVDVRRSVLIQFPDQITADEFKLVSEFVAIALRCIEHSLEPEPAPEMAEEPVSADPIDLTEPEIDRCA